MEINPLLNAIATNIVNPLILLLFAVALLVFLWGIFEFIKDSADQEGRDKGRSNIMYGLIGMVIMFSAYGIINLILGTLGISGN